LITQYVKNQLKQPVKKKNKFFNISLELGLLKYLVVLLTTEFKIWSELHKKFYRKRVTNKRIIGLKLQLSGK
jgi:hypothetical protein